MAGENKLKSDFGLLETMRAYYGKIVYLDAHLERLKNSCHLAGIPFSYNFGELKVMINRAVKRSGFQDVYLRLTLWNNQQLPLVTTKKYRPYSRQKYQKGFSAGVSSLRQNESSLLARLKSTKRMLYQLTLEEAKKRGFDEAILLNQHGYLAEGSRANLFFIKDKKIFTPALECGCLAGITRRVVFDLAKRHYRIYAGNFTLQDLLKADEAFLTNSLIGVIPLVGVEKEKIKIGRRGKITEYLMERYFSLLKNGG